ncbi:hypothetical protein ACFWN2_02340 [Lentzea sp. NPDC058436]|uniref:hypothetical protein n=1 Tax=Lentzea sp. NPDC058436 TaxID=3346499 RepID=UPI0036581B04
MKDFTAELEQVFGVVPSAETGLMVDTFDGADVDGNAAVGWSTTTGRPAVGWSTITGRPAVGWSTTTGRPAVAWTSCRVAATGTCRVAVPA